MRLGEYIAARQLLSPLTASTQTAGIRASAEEILEQIAVLERQADDFVARLEGQKLETARPGRPRREAPVYRPLQPGESRVEGLLERINCAAKEIVIEVNVAGTTERFVAESLNSLAFISHRDDLRSMIACTAPHATRSRLRHVAPGRSAVKPAPGDRGGVPATSSVA